ncbi:MAG: DNA polymerase III subunit gamma/tau [Clostridia bacterium]|nr:DNA polymerase III subunit gamma/tau [Clostridia bacterium]
MGHLALYRKYRPSSFDDVYGQDHVTSVLKRESEEGRLSHAYLFCGPRGTGKTTCAKILAKAVNCEFPVKGEPCGKCSSCLAIDSETATDVVEMDAASNTGVDYIRDIKDEVTYTPALLKKRVYIIDEVHMLSSGAFNALLKTLEEPPAHVMFILATTEQHKLPATVVSRCQRFEFRRIPIDIISARLSDIASKEKIDLDPDAAQIIAKQASGGMRDAINLMELCAGGGSKIDPGRVRDALGISGIDLSADVARSVKYSDAAGLFSAIDYVVSSSGDLSVFFGELIGFWRDMTVMRFSADDSSYLELTDTEKKIVKESSTLFTPEELLYHCGLLENAIMEMTRQPQIKRFVAEITLLKMSDKKLESSSDSLLARLAGLEDQIKLLKAGAAVPLETEKVPETVDHYDGPEVQEHEPSHDETEKTSSLTEEYSEESVSSEIGDPGEFISKIAESNASVGMILQKAVLKIEDNKKLIITVADGFSSSMLKRNDVMPLIKQSAVISGLFESPPEVEILLDEKSGDQIDVFSDFIDN